MDSAKRKINLQTICGGLVVLLLAAFFFWGLRIFRDYGASSDEINQIEAGHIIWNTICERLGRGVHDFGELPKLEDYYNRYYGQAATFPTVLIEAVRHFQMDISSVLRLRHFWNFLLYFCGLVCFSLLIKKRFLHNEIVFLLLLIHILTPRIFGDAFYNDRDVMLISLCWMALLCFQMFRQKPNLFTALLCGFAMALVINTRYFGLVLIFLPILYMAAGGSKRYSLLLIAAVPLFFYILSPVLWNNFLSQTAEGFRIFSTGTQRTQETQGLATILFFGNYIPENDLPFYYVPLWIFISTPLVPQIFTGIGLFKSFGRKIDLTDQFMRLLLCLGIAAVMLIRPVLYNGWRHLYFFYIPVFWFAGCGLEWLLNRYRPWFKLSAVLVLFISLGFTASRIAYLHPYEYVYLNPFFSSREGEFDRDYWRLSTTDGLKWIWDQEQDEFRVSDTNAGLDNSVIALFPWQRERIIINQYNALHRFPSDYLICNFSGVIGNEQNFPLYVSDHIMERDGVKMAEVFKRLPAVFPAIQEVHPDLPEILDGQIDLETEWRSEKPQNPEDEVLIAFEEMTTLSGLSVLPGNDENEYARSPEVSVSDDGESWTVLPLTVSNLFDLSFPETETKWLRIRNTNEADVHWSIREIYLYE